MTELKPRLPVAGRLGWPRAHAPHLEAGRDFHPMRTASRSSERTWAKRYHSKLLVTDTIIIIVAVVGAFFARFGFLDTDVPVSGVASGYWILSPVIVTVWLFSLSASHSRDTRVVGLGATEYKRVVNASAITFGLLAIVFLVGKVDVARGYFVLALPLGTISVLLSRWLWRQWLIRQRKFDHYLSRALVVGRLEDVHYVVGQIHKKSGAAYNVVGAALEDADVPQVNVGPREVPVVASTLAGVAEAASRYNADTVIVAGQPRSGGDFIRSLAWQLEGSATELVLASRLTDVAGPRIHFRPVEGLPLIHVEIPQFEGGKHVLKRAMDVVASGMALIVLMPLMFAIGVFIRGDSHGPVLFRQERVGRNGETFMMLKFRSMVVTAENDLAALMAKNEGAGLLFKMKDDPRVTRVGRVLRKFSLDELPQLWNVFIGDMSLVGPRPPLEREVEGYARHVRRRLYIKPGLTGMWQVNGRSDLSWDESVRLDLYYVENWSVMGDLVIMWRTVKVMLHPVGAY